MQQRSPAVQAFLHAVREAFAASQADRTTARCVDATFALLDAAVGAANPGGRRFPVCAMLPQALLPAQATSPELARVAAAILALDPLLAWSRRDGGPHASENIMEGHANAMVIGPGGLEDRRDAWVGLSLLAPRVRYPDHRHQPEEAYLVLSPGAFRQNEGGWFEPGVGGTFFNEPGITHAMRSDARALVAVWCLRPELD